MPEGPEVKTTTDFLKKFVGKQISGFTILSGRYLKKEEGIPNTDSTVVLPAILESVNCKGKFIYFTFSYDKGNKNYYLFSTLGMTGMWTTEKTKHSRLAILIDNKMSLYYNDMRNFGTLKFINDKIFLDKKLKSLGPDVLNDEVTWDLIKAACLNKPNKTIAECLMNQSVISGIGNYLKSEILYKSKISPHRVCKDIEDEEWIALGSNALLISRLSYSLGGATIKDYRKADGTKGSFGRRFAVYNCKFDPSNNIIIKETTKDKRSTCWVPKSQK